MICYLVQRDGSGIGMDRSSAACVSARTILWLQHGAAGRGQNIPEGFASTLGELGASPLGQLVSLSLFQSLCFHMASLVSLQHGVRVWAFPNQGGQTASVVAGRQKEGIRRCQY